MLKNTLRLDTNLKMTKFPKKLLILSISLTLFSFHYVVAETKDHDKHEHQEQIAKQKSVQHDHDKAKNEHSDHDENKPKHSEHNKKSGEQQHSGHNHAEGEEEEAGFVKVSAAQQAMAGIKVASIKEQKNINQIISAPGEVVNDLYHTTILTTQIDSKVLQRKVVLGQHVEQGDIIAILYSLDIATIQNQLKVSLSEWRRVQKLGKKTVGAKRFIKAKAAFDKNKALLLAYGFNISLLDQLIKGKHSYKAGEYPVIAPHAGIIKQDNFQSGQFLAKGSTIALLVDEEQVWIEALLAPEIGQRIKFGTKAKVIVGKKTFFASVIHDSHAIDEVTRTRKIRLMIENSNHLLHAGLFAKVFLEIPLTKNIILIPETALMRSADGDWAVFVEQQPGVFKQQEVELENTINAMHSVKGLKAGQRIAIEGAFFLASEFAKGGFDPHNH